MLKTFAKLVVLSLAPVALATLLAAGSVQASLIGDTVDAGIFRADGTRVLGFNLDGPFVVAAGPGDARLYSNVFVLDVEALGFTTDYQGIPAGWSPGVEFRIFDLDPGFDIGSLVIDTNFAGWDDSRATFTAHSATFLWGDLSFTSDTHFNVTFAPGAGAVPGPASVLLLGLGFAGLAAARRRRP